MNQQQAKQQIIATLESSIVKLKNAIVENCNGWIVCSNDGLGLAVNGNVAIPVSLVEATRYETKQQAIEAMQKFDGEYKVKSAGLAMLKEINNINKLIKQANKQ